MKTKQIPLYNRLLVNSKNFIKLVCISYNNGFKYKVEVVENSLLNKYMIRI